MSDHHMDPLASTAAEPPISRLASIPKSPQFPPHKEPRIWFVTDGLSPIAIALSRRLLQHGDYVISGVLPSDYLGVRGDEMRELIQDVAREREGDEDVDGGDVMDVDTAKGSGEKLDDDDSGEEARSPPSKRQKRWRERFKIVALDGRAIGQCQSAVAEALGALGRIDILAICQSEAIVGSIEELSQSDRAQSLVRDQFETNFFAPVNLIKSALPSMRARRNGHIVAMTGISGHLGTPGLGMYCASQWALEGYCDSLAYEIAPFNIKMTIVQPNLEIAVLTNKLTSVPALPEYAPDVNPAPLSREILSGLLDRLVGVPQDAVDTFAGAGLSSPHSLDDTTTPRSQNEDLSQSSPGDLLHTSTISSLYPPLQAQLRAALIAETVFALAAIGGHDNPPARHIVGFEGVTSVKEKLKTVSEELEDFVEVSAAVDIGKDEEVGLGLRVGETGEGQL